MNLVIAELFILVLLVFGFFGYHRYRVSMHRRSRDEVHSLRRDLYAAQTHVEVLQLEVNEALAEAGKPPRYVSES